MTHEIKLLEKRLAEEPIQIPKNPFLEVFERFGLCEFLALGLGRQYCN